MSREAFAFQGEIDVQLGAALSQANHEDGGELHANENTLREEEREGLWQ